MWELNPTPTPALTAQVVDLPGGSILVDRAAQAAFRLNPSARAVWDGLACGLTEADLVAELAARADAPADAVRGDVRALIADLTARGLLTGPVAPEAPTGPWDPTVVPVVPDAPDAAATDRAAPTPHQAGPFAALRHVFTLRGTDAALLARAAAPFAPLRAAAAAVPGTVYTLRTNAEATTLEIDGAPFACGVAERALTSLAFHVNQSALRSVRDALVLHAGAVSRNGRVIAFPAAGGSGKSTLVAGLLSRGFDYLSDEGAVIGPDLAVTPYPRAIGLGDGSLAALPEAADAVSAGRAARVDKWHVPPAALRPDAVASGGRLVLVVEPRYRAGAVTTLTRLSPVEAFESGFGQVVARTPLPAVAVATLARMAGELPWLRLEYSDLDDAAATLRRLCEADDVRDIMDRPHRDGGRPTEGRRTP